MKKVSLIFSLVLMMSVMLSSVLQAQDTPKKKWSPVAKGAVIGAGTGAAAGAIINKKNRVAGGIVGGVVGGAVGAGVGKIVQNKQQKKAAEEKQRMEQINQVAAANEPAPVYNSGTARSYAATTHKKKTHKVSHATARTETAPVIAESASESFRNGLIPNDGEGDPTLAYSDSEYKQKSW